MSLNEAHLRKQAGEGFTTATELADALVREAGLPFRLAHKVVAGMVQDAVKAGVPSTQLTLDMLQTAAQRVLGRTLPFSAGQLSQALDPAHFVAIRAGEGGVAPSATALLLGPLQRDLDRADGECAAARVRLVEADTLRTAAIARIG